MAHLGLGGVRMGQPDRSLPDSTSLVALFSSELGITLNGLTVSSWADQSGRGNTVTQGTASAQPTYIAVDPLFNGQPSLNFVVASSQNLTQPGFSVSQPSTIYCVGWLNAATTVFVDGSVTRQIVGASTSTWALYSGGSVVSDGSSDSKVHVFCSIYNAVNSFGYIDDSRTAAMTGNSGVAALSGLALGGVAGSFLQGALAHCRIFSIAHTPAQVATEFAYLGHKYNVTTH